MVESVVEVEEKGEEAILGKTTKIDKSRKHDFDYIYVCRIPNEIRHVYSVACVLDFVQRS